MIHDDSMDLDEDPAERGLVLDGPADEDEDDADTHATKVIGTPSSSVLQCLEGGEHARKAQAGWPRPPFDSEAVANNSPLKAMFVDADYVMEWSGIRRRAVLRVSAVEESGASLLMHVYDFMPYFWVQAAPGKELPPKHEILQKFNYGATGVSGITVEQRRSIYYYDFGVSRPTYRIQTFLPGQVAKCRSILETAYNDSVVIFEANVGYVLRWMCDHQISGSSWMQANNWKRRAPEQCVGTRGVSLEVNISVKDLTPLKDRFELPAGQRLLSFDIECDNDESGRFPKADRPECRIVQIGNTVHSQGEGRWRRRILFALEECAPIGGDVVLSFATEQELLEGWELFVQTLDPDYFTGHNINSFDFPYIVNRAEFLKMRPLYLGRMCDRPTTTKKTVFQSKQTGKREENSSPTPGRAQLDLLQIVQKDTSLRLPSNTLNSLAAHYLGDQKEDLHHSLIRVRQREGPQGRKALGVYCLKDTSLPVELMSKLMCMVNYIEMARVTGVPINYLLSRGQQIRIITLILMAIAPKGKYGAEGFLVPTKKRAEEGGKFEGATVIEPVKGFYKEPIATLDFASLVSDYTLPCVARLLS